MRWLAVFSSLALSQVIVQSRAYGGSMADVLVRALADPNGYLLAGHTRSKDGLLARKGYDADFWVIRVDQLGNLVWQAVYGTEGDDELTDVCRLPDGSLLVVGWTDGRSVSHGKRDAFIVRADPLGQRLWQQALGGSANDVALGVALIDSVWWVVGQAGGYDSVAAPRHQGGLDGWLLRLSWEGQLLSAHTYGGSKNEYLRLIIPFSPDTIWLVGASDSPDGDIANPLGKMDIWVVEVDKTGRFRRSWNIGGSDFEEPYSWTRSPEGEVWVAGTSFSPALSAAGRADGVVWRIDPEGLAQVAWQGGGSGDEGLNFLHRLPDGDWLLAGMTSSRDGLIPRLAGLYDGWAARWSPGPDSLIFSVTFGGKDVDRWEAVYPLSSGVYVSWGTTVSTGEALGGIRTYGNADFWGLWWKPDTIPLPQPLALESPTWLTGYLHLAGPPKGPAVILIKTPEGLLLDSLRIDRPGFFQWQVPDTLQSLRLSLHSPGFLWKELACRIVPHRENHIDIRLEPVRSGARVPLFFVYFDKGSARLRPEAYSHLDDFARFLRENPSWRIELAGHTDGTSKPESEIQLSRDRALAVRDYLVHKGLPRERFQIVGYGKARPIADNDTPEGQQKNRRVEFRILGL